MNAVPPSFVSACDAARIRVENGDDGEAGLKKLGLQRADNGIFELRAEAISFAELALIATGLRDMGLPFSGGSDWAPAETVRYLRDQGLFSGAFDEISWTGPSDWTVRAG